MDKNKYEKIEQNAHQPDDEEFDTINITTRNGTVHRFTFDDNGRMILYSNTFGYMEQRCYDNNDNEIYFTNSNNNIIESVYDDQNRLMVRRFNDDYEENFKYRGDSKFYSSYSNSNGDACEVRIDHDNNTISFTTISDDNDISIGTYEFNGETCGKLIKEETISNIDIANILKKTFKNPLIN